MFNQSHYNNNYTMLFSQSSNNILPNVKKLNTNNLTSTSSSKSFDSFFIENNSKSKDLNLKKSKKNKKTENYNLNTFRNDDISFSSFDPFKELTSKKKESLNLEKVNNILKELNSQLIKMNYCNIIQSNSIKRLDLSLSFLSSQIQTLKFLNRKRKAKLTNCLKN